jgi:hypothetical protein
MFNFLVTKLVLVGFKRESATLIEEGLTINYVVCYYSNISNFGFVKGCIEDSNSLSEYNDTYINKNTLDIKDIIEFTKYDENIILKLEESSLVKYFNHVEKELCARMQEEMR